MSTVVTVTLNPTVDVAFEGDRLISEGGNRARRCSVSRGGGGINVARCVGRLGGSAVALHTAGREVGARLDRLLDEEGLDHRRIEVGSDTRDANVPAGDDVPSRTGANPISNDMATDDTRGMTDSNPSSVPSAPDHPTVLAAMRLASRAPSVHNTQPWRWEFDGTRLHLRRDNDRLLSAADPLGRQLVISCGAMLHHVRTAFAAQGWHTDTTRLPDPEQPDYLAVIDFRGWPDPPDSVLARARAIDRRHTDRLPMLPPRDWPQLVHTARMLVTFHDLELSVLDDSVRSRLAAASEQATAMRRYDMEYQSELRWWVGHSSGPEGIPRNALVSDAESARVSVGRKYPSAPHSARRDTLEDQSRLLMLSSITDSQIDWLYTGEALSALLLECTAAKLATCALTHITELPTGRKALASLLPHPGVPQVVIRIGTAPDDEAETPPTPRRPLADILTMRH
ncbi:MULTISPECIES: Acg family FMN-binding oxidoreductase [unclassified Nocardia]|uniref:Acg family FMN-binding oxidoreductase n=1 Tax=unclassified Nocardia TaxID=2637762 RepID=UPI003419A087